MAGRRDRNDSRNKLYEHTIDVIKRTKPKCFCLENVKGILSYTESDGVKVIDKIIKKLSEYGYYSRCITLDAANFNVPQKRERVIFIGAPTENREKVDIVISELIETRCEVKTTRGAIEDLEKVEENKS